MNLLNQKELSLKNFLYFSKGELVLRLVCPDLFDIVHANYESFLTCSNLATRNKISLNFSFL